MSKDADSKQYRVIVDPSAYDRLFHHVMFLAEVSVEAAEELRQTIIADIRSLATMPHRNPTYTNQFLTATHYRWMLSGKRYKIIYRVEGDAVYIDNIKDCREAD